VGGLINYEFLEKALYDLKNKISIKRGIIRGRSFNPKA